MSTFNPLDHPVCLAEPLRMASSSWAVHVPFAMLLVDLLRPSTIVELGTQNGVSYCAFCQAVKQLGLSARCYAIGTWEEDGPAHFYGPEMLADLRLHHDPLYGGFSRLMQSAYDDVVTQFADSSIDLLHIDGSHSYDAVKHDFETWLPKMSKRGVVILHDTNERARDVGIWRLWEELTDMYPSFSMTHGHGLGVLAVGKEQLRDLGVLWDLVGEDLVRFRDYFYQLGRRVELQSERDQAGQSLTGHLLPRPEPTQDNPLWEYFSHNPGHVIHKWHHYFDIYHIHFSRFRGQPVKLMEIGVARGGSLQMWKRYFGPKAHIYGVDVDPGCKAFEEEQIRIFIGDQADRGFLALLRDEIGPVDIVIDDGGHRMEQQIATFEELYPWMSETGVYLVEDLHTSYWQEYGGHYRQPGTFIEYAKGFVDQINAWHSRDPELSPSGLTKSAAGLHFYDSVLVIEKYPHNSKPAVSMTGGNPKASTS